MQDESFLKAEEQRLLLVARQASIFGLVYVPFSLERPGAGAIDSLPKALTYLNLFFESGLADHPSMLDLEVQEQPTSEIPEDLTPGFLNSSLQANLNSTEYDAISHALFEADEAGQEISAAHLVYFIHLWVGQVEKRGRHNSEQWTSEKFELPSLGIKGSFNSEEWTLGIAAHTLKEVIERYLNGLSDSERARIEHGLTNGLSLSERIEHEIYSEKNADDGAFFSSGYLRL